MRFMNLYISVLLCTVAVLFTAARQQGTPPSIVSPSRAQTPVETPEEVGSGVAPLAVGLHDTERFGPYGLGDRLEDVLGTAGPHQFCGPWQAADRFPCKQHQPPAATLQAEQILLLV